MSTYSSSPLLFETTSLSCGYEKEILLFQDANIQLHQGEIIGLVGDNGSGKTSFLKALKKGLPYKKGIIKFLGKEVMNLSANTVSEQVKYMQQDRLIFSDLHVMEHLEVAANGMLKDINDNIDYLFKRLPEIRAFKKTKVFKLSGGERALLSFAMAVISNPMLVLLDEPTANLDKDMKQKMKKIILDLNREKGISFAIVEQQIAFLKGICCRGYRFTLEGKPEEVVL